MAEFEREIIRERVIAGIRRGQSRGKQLGRPRVVEDLKRARELGLAGWSFRAIAAELGVSVGKVHASLAEAEH